MPIPFLILGIIAGSATVGAGKTVKAGIDQSKAKKVNDESRSIIEQATEKADNARELCNQAIYCLGVEKIHVLETTAKRFVRSFEKIHSIDLQESKGITELANITMDQTNIGDLKKMTLAADSIVKGMAGGSVAGAITAFGAYNSAMILGTASTGTAISTLSGAAATKATLAFLGGGALKAGGLGIAGGTTVLGGLIAGPALAVFGIVVGAKASANKDRAYSNYAKAEEYEEEMALLIEGLRGIRLRANMFERLIIKLNSLFEPLVLELESLIIRKGSDFRLYSPKEKEFIGKIMSTAGAVKAVIDTPILSESGGISDVSLGIAENTNRFINQNNAFLKADIKS